MLKQTILKIYRGFIKKTHYFTKHTMRKLTNQTKLRTNLKKNYSKVDKFV